MRGFLSAGVKISTNISQFTLIIDHYTVAENFIMTFSKEVICYIAIVRDMGRKKKPITISTLKFF
jgi:hypothetical protein